jgi:uncharacterized OB-fold protein
VSDLVSEPLRAEHVVRFAYQRTVGGATGRFLAGLARCEVWGSRTAADRVVVPPMDHDPDSGAPTREFARVGDRGTVRSWTWVEAPAPGHPLPRPFAFALIRLDGADTDLLHVVDVDSEFTLAAGLRVRAVWREERGGSIGDIQAFRPDSSQPDNPAPDGSQPRGSRPASSPPEAAPRGAGPGELRSSQAPPNVDPEAPPLTSDLELHYGYEPGLVLSRFLRELGRRRIEGGRCPGCAAVYVPPRPRCPACGAGPMAPVDVPDRGVVASYAVARVPPYGSAVQVPFAWASIRLDGTDVPFPHLLADVPLDEIRVGMRVRAVWVPAAELAPTWASIRHFGPER